MKNENLNDEQAISSNGVLPAVIFLPDEKLPERQDEEESESIEVGVIMEGEHFEGYYDYDNESWWIDLGGITVGHRKMDWDEIEGWYYLAKK